ncbi:MAG: hypothetical protein MJK12_13935 [Colwellia sp.]|nr:hypothetical protein [Colwellia sp.]
MSYSSNDVSSIEIPFEHRHHCWFCGEPSQSYFIFPSNHSNNFYKKQYIVLNCSHPRLSVPCCAECHRLANQAEVDSIWAVNEDVKRRLLHIYRKDLAIGINWTKEELENSEFEGGSFAGFKKSAWFIYEVAKERVNFDGWPINYHGIELVITTDEESFIFDGVTYPKVEDAVTHYCQVFSLNKLFFQTALGKIGIKRFAYVVRFCRLLVGATPNEQKQSLKELV